LADTPGVWGARAHGRAPGDTTRRQARPALHATQACHQTGWNDCPTNEEAVKDDAIHQCWLNCHSGMFLCKAIGKEAASQVNKYLFILNSK